MIGILIAVGLIVGGFISNTVSVERDPATKKLKVNTNQLTNAWTEIRKR